MQKQRNKLSSSKQNYKGLEKLAKRNWQKMKLAGVSGYESGFVFDMINNAVYTLKIKSDVNNFVKYRKYMSCVF